LLSSQILARIKNIHVRAGNNVQKGQLLVTLESEGLKAQLAQSIAMVDASQAMLTVTKVNFERAQTLKEKGLVSQSELDVAVTNFRRYGSELVAANQRKQAAQTALEYSKINSPFSGVVVERSAESGNMASPGQLLLSLYDPLTLIEFDSNLRPGMFARMLIKDGTKEVLSVPVDYVKSFGQLDMAWLLKDGNLSRRFVRLGKYQLNQVEIVSGLNSGDILALSAN
jgi:membrane fusion protein (multidrug efflux system)